MRTFRLLYPATAVFLGLIFFTAGTAKLYFEHRFPGLIGPVWLADRLSEYGLGLFGQFIAVAQIVVGFMVLTPRYRTLGAVMLVPMVVNILVVTISLQWRGTPYVLAFLLLLNAGLLWRDSDRLMHFITGKPPVFEAVQPARNWKGHLVWLTGPALVFAGVALSYVALSVSYVVVVAGIASAWLSRRFDG